MKKLANPQQQIYEYIISYSREHAYPPSIREICKAVGLNSTATVYVHLKNLEQKGLIVRDPTKQRSIQVPALQPQQSAFAAGSYAPQRFACHEPDVTRYSFSEETAQHNVPLVGDVAAGVPILAAENIEDAFPLPNMLVRGKPVDELYMLRVEGDSMIDAGIQSGDILVVQHDCDCENGDIVVARVQGEAATVKRLYREKTRVRLQPENALYSPIYVRFDELEIDGKVIGLLRSMR